jgi:hypothetical protein
VILINLLPHREEARKRRKEAFQATMFASFLLGLAIAGAIYWWFQIMITDQLSGALTTQIEIHRHAPRRHKTRRSIIRLGQRAKRCNALL